MTGRTDIRTGRPYPAYKDSGVEWLGEVPAHWDVQRLRHVVTTLFSNVDKHSKEEERPVRLCNYSDVYYNDHIDCDLNFMKATATAEEIERFRLVADDVLITKDSEAWDDIGVPALVRETDGDLVCGYHLALLRPINDKVSGRFLRWSLSSRGLASQFHVRANGVTRFGLSQDAVKSVRIPIPPVAEQAAISRFLDDATSRIDRHIRAKEKLIALLEELKQALVHEAVTGQIDVRRGRPYSAYKSGVAGDLGQVPKHWRRWRLKGLLRSVDQRSATGTETLLSLRRDHGVVVYADHFARPPQGATLVGFKRVRPGQLVVNRLQANNGLVFHSALAGLVSPDYSVFEAARPFEMQYLSDLLRLLEYRAHFRREAKGLGTGTAGFLRLYDDAFLRTVVHLPPVDEQRLIVDWLEETVQKIDQVLAKMRRERDLMKVFERCLVADAVTGKVDVRQAAAELKEESAEGGVGAGNAIADPNSFGMEGRIPKEATS